MKFLGHHMTMKGLETVAKRFRGASPGTDTNLHRVTVADAREMPAKEMAAAEEAERTLEAARAAVAERRTRNDSERQRLRDVAHKAREAADDAPSRRLAREQDAIANDAERQIADSRAK